MRDLSGVQKFVVGIGAAAVVFSLFDIFMFGATFINVFLGLGVSGSLVASAFLPQKEEAETTHQSLEE